MLGKYTTSVSYCLLITILLASCAPATLTVIDQPDRAETTPISSSPSLTPTSANQVASHLLYVQGVTVTTLAGDGHWGYRDGPSPQARFLGPEGLAVDEQRNIYVADRSGNRIRLISSDGTVSTLAGSGAAGYKDEPALEAQFNNPFGIALDGAGNLYVADYFNHCIRLVHPDGTVNTLAGDGTAGYQDGPAVQALFDLPAGVALSPSGVLYIADSGNNRIRAVSPQGMVTTLAGSGEQGSADGPPDKAQFDTPFYLAIGSDGNIYVSEGCEPGGNPAIRWITPEGVVTTVAGKRLPGRADGPVSEAGFSCPRGLEFDTAGNLYVADAGNARIRVITTEDQVYTLAGKGTNGYADGEGPQAAFLQINGIALDGEGHLYTAEFLTNRIRVIQLPETIITSPPPPTPDPYVGQNVIKIGFVDEVYMGGYVSVPTGNAVQLAIDEANSAGGVIVEGAHYTFALVRAQDWLQPPHAGAQAAAQDLVDQGVVAVVGHVLSENSIAGAEVYGPTGVVMVSATSSDPGLTQAGWQTIYRVTSNDDYMAPIAARMTYEQLGLRRAVLLGEEEPHVKTAMDAWQEAFESLGGQVLGSFESEPDFSEEVMTQIQNLSPEAVIFFPVRKLNTTKIVKQVLDTNINTVIIGVEAFGDPTFLSTLSDAAEGIYDAIPGVPPAAMPGYAGFTERYRAAEFAIMPNPDNMLAKYNPYAYDAANLIITAILLAAENGAVTPESVAATMETFRHQPYQGIIGAIQFDEVGDLLDQPVYFKRVVNGQWVDIVP